MSEWGELTQRLKRVFEFCMKLVGAARGQGPAIRVVIFGTHVAKASIAKIWDALGFFLGPNIIQIIEIESVKRRDGANGVPPMWAKSGKVGSWFYAVLNPRINRRVIAVEPSTDRGRAIIYDILAGSDIFITNQTESLLKKFGLDWKTLHARFPHLIMGEGSFYGRTGPQKDRTGFHHTASFESAQAMLADWHPGAPTNDLGYGSRIVLLTLAAFFERLYTGKGSRVDVSLMEWALESISWQAGFVWNARIARRVWSRLVAEAEAELRRPLADEEVVALVANHAIGPQPFDAHWALPLLFRPPCRARNGGLTSIVIAAVTDDMVRGLFVALGYPELGDDPRFSTAEARLNNREELWGILVPVIQEMTEDELYELLAKHRVPVGRKRGLHEVLRDPQLLDRDMIQQVEGPDGEPLWVVGIAGRIGEQSPVLVGAARFGEDTTKVLEFLALSDLELRELHKEGVIHCVEFEA